MKKALFTIALVAFTFAANAQFVVGGQIEYNTDGSSYFSENVAGTTTTTWTMPGNRFTNTNTSTLSILPKIGYNLNDKMQVGASFGITWDKTVDYSAYTWEYRNIADFEGWQRTTQMGIKFAPYFRYNLTQFKGFTLFCEAQLAFTFGLNPSVHNYNVAYTDSWGFAVAAVDEDVEGITDTYTDITFTVVPGLNYKFSNKFSADIYIDLLGLGFNHLTERRFTDLTVVAGAPAGTTTETVYNTNTFFLVANANAQDLNTHLNAFRIGFNYHF